MIRAAEIVFFSSWILCGCTIEGIFDGALPLFGVALLVMLASAWVLGHKD